MTNEIDTEPRKARNTAGAGRRTVQSVARTLDILESLASCRGPKTISRLARLVGLHVSTVHRLLGTLVERGYVRQDPDSSRYHLGSRIFTLERAADNHLDLRLMARPFLERLMYRSGETASLVTESEREGVYLDQVAGMHLVKMSTTPGTRVPLHCTGAGKVLLAYRGAGYAEPLLCRTLRAYTARTISTRAALEKELTKIRKQGYSIDNEEMEDGVRCLAVPIFDRRNDCVGALSVSGPITRMTIERVEQMAPGAGKIAAELSRELGATDSVLGFYK